MLLPRLFALCEVQWCEPSRKDEARIKKSITEHQIPIIELLGYNYCKTFE